MQREEEAEVGTHVVVHDVNDVKKWVVYNVYVRLVTKLFRSFPHLGIEKLGFVFDEGKPLGSTPTVAFADTKRLLQFLLNIFLGVVKCWMLSKSNFGGLGAASADWTRLRRIRAQLRRIRLTSTSKPFCFSTPCSSSPLRCDTQGSQRALLACKCALRASCFSFSFFLISEFDIVGSVSVACVGSARPQLVVGMRCQTPPVSPFPV